MLSLLCFAFLLLLLSGSARLRRAVLQLNHCSKALPLQTILKLSWLSKERSFSLISIVGRIRALGVKSLQKTKR